MRSLLRRFLTDRKGNIAILFAFALIPVIGSMGAAVDYSMASAQRVTLQAAVDATGLSLAKIMPASQSELEARGMEWFKANMGLTPITNLTLNITATVGKINIEAHGYYQPELISVLGVTSFPISAHSEIKWGNTRLRVALVLDVTGSMSSAGKMTAMQTATKNLLTQLKNAAVVNGDVYVSIVPFNKDVAVATSNWNANWVDFTQWEARAAVHGYLARQQRQPDHLGPDRAGLHLSLHQFEPRFPLRQHPDDRQLDDDYHSIERHF